ASSRAEDHHFKRLHADMLAIFPQLQGVPIRHRWYGLVATTLDALPHIGSLESCVHFGMRYNGRGVALSALFGRTLASMAHGDTMTPMGQTSEGGFDPIPFHAWRVPANLQALNWLQWRDTFQA